MPCAMPIAPIWITRAFVASGPVVSVSTAAAAIAISGVALVAGFNFVPFGMADCLPLPDVPACRDNALSMPERFDPACPAA
ncbi:hypothetical protein BQ8482_20293 [Mesorhizobium delmotii]|uniref:Uncharacterized protein n=1 Tax=Mesorhizobium delmotii TaxID=1631247 RepID=A0A2P9AKR1_9HYPH|nr:hypothetical protein BQ8482_20293 [Mesorhizobium delmotii]